MSLRRKTEIQVADLSDRSTDVVLKHVVQLAAKSRIVTGKKSHIRLSRKCHFKKYRVCNPVI